MRSAKHAVALALVLALCGCMNSMSPSIDDARAIDIAKTEAAKIKYDVPDMTFDVVTEQMAGMDELYEWASVTEEEKLQNVLVYGEPTIPGMRGNAVLFVINKETGDITRTMQAR